MRIPVWRQLVELYRFREMLFVLVERDVKARSKQSLLGYAWIIIQPLIATGVFAILVQGVLGLSLTDNVPYPVFVYTGMVLWQYFSSSLAAATITLTNNANLITQVYFPKNVLVLYPILGKLVELGVSLLVLAPLLWVFHVAPSWTLIFLPALVLLTVVLAWGLALFLAPLNVGLRDVSQAVPIVLGFALYAVPVLYPLEAVPAQWRVAYLLNPMAVATEGFRAAILGVSAIPLWAFAWTMVATIVILILGQLVFSLFERVLADVI